MLLPDARLGRDLEIVGDGAPARAAPPKAVRQQGLPGARPARGATAPTTSCSSSRCSARPSSARPCADGSFEYLRIAKDVQTVAGRRQSERAAPARLQRHQRARQGPLPDPRLRRQSAGRGRHRPSARATSGARLGLRGRGDEERQGRRAGSFDDVVVRVPNPLLAAVATIAAMSTTIEQPRSAGPGSGLGGDWRVIVRNDDHNTFEHVARTLAAVIPGVSLDAGPPARRPDPQQRPGDRLVGPARARRALLGAARRGRADDGARWSAAEPACGRLLGAEQRVPGRAGSAGRGGR